MAYATIDELAAGWREFAAWERPVVEKMLDDASLFIDEQLDKAGLSPEGVKPATLSYVCRALVRRSKGELDPTDADATWAESIGAESVEVAPAVRHSDFRLLKDEKRMLGIRLGAVGFAGCA